MRTLIVDDHVLLRGALRRLIETFDMASAIEEASNGKEAVEFLAQGVYDLVLMDIQMPVMNGVEAMKEIRKLTHPPRVIVLTQFDEEALILHMISLGANAFVFKNCEDRVLESTIQKVLSEGYHYNSEIMGMVSRKLSGKFAPGALTLTPRENQLMTLLAQGKSSKEIAGKLHLRVSTIESYRKGLLEKTHCGNTAELVSLAFRTGLVDTSYHRKQ